MYENKIHRHFDFPVLMALDNFEAKLGSLAQKISLLII